MTEQIRSLEQCAANRYSQFGEDGILAAVFNAVKPQNRWCFECGATDGIFFSNTRNLIEQGWNGILVEGDPDAFKRLVENNKEFGDRVSCANTWLGKDATLDQVLNICKAPTDIDLVVIDVDGQDYHIFNSILAYRPRVIMLEFDPLREDPHFIPTIGGKGQAGLAACKRLAVGRFYQPVCETYCNLILVRKPLQQLLIQTAEPNAAT